MDRALLTEIIQEQYREMQALPLGIERERLQDILDVLKLPHIIAITGMRRSGKSTLMLQALKLAFSESVYYLDFEDERLITFNVDDFNLLNEIFIELYGIRKTFFFDEIQVVSGWESYIRRMYKSNNKFIISGSSAELLSSELSTKLTGRHTTIELLPFSFREYLDFSENNVDTKKPRLTIERGLLKKAFNDYLEFGGIPEFLQYKNPVILKGIYENIIYKDVIVRYDIKDVKALRELSLWLLSNPGALISYSKLKNSLQLGSVNTVKNYIHYLENAYLIFTMDKYSYSVADQALSQKKSYVVDTGLMSTIGFQFSKNSGKYLENVVYLQLRRNNNFSIYYYKTKNNLEVDFCLRKGQKIISLIQVAEHINNKKTRDREVRALVTAMDEMNIKEGLIITADQAEKIEIDGKHIQVISIVDWLLQ